MDRRKLQSELLRFEREAITKIVDGVIHHTPKRFILKEIKADLVRFGTKLRLEMVELNRLWVDAIKKYDIISKKTFANLRKKKKTQENLQETTSERQKRSDAVYEVVRKYIIRTESAQKISYDVSIEAEKRLKHDAIYGINGFIKKNQANLSRYSPFFICSVHANCAEGHKDYQGKIYIDEDWAKFVQNESLRKKIDRYVRRRGIQTVQWVCGEPVYMLTRTNCRHYFKKATIQDVLGSPIKKLIETYKMEEDEHLLVSPIKSALNRYMKRLGIEKELAKVLISPKLMQDIKKDKILIRKWRIQYLSSLHG